MHCDLPQRLNGVVWQHVASAHLHCSSRRLGCVGPLPGALLRTHHLETIAVRADEHTG
jgi:hypothetical protein